MMKSPIRGAISVAVALMLAVTASACTASPGPEPSDEPNAAEPTQGGDLRIVVQSEPRSLVFSQDNNRSSFGIAGLITEPLALKDPETSQPITTGLATGWEQVDPLTWEITFREGVTFTNGEVFDASAAASNLLTYRDAATGPTAPYFKTIESAEAKDAATLVVTSTVPMPYLPNLLMLVHAVPPAYYEEVGDVEFGKAPIGVGPFAFDSWQPGQAITLVRNDDYYGEVPYVDSVTFSWSPESSTRTGLLASGDADILAYVGPDQVDDLETAGAPLYDMPSIQNIMAFMNAHEPPFDDPELRRAVAHAIDRDTLVEVIFGERFALASDLYFPSLFASSKHSDGVEPIEYDLERAQEMVEELNLTTPIPLYWTTGRYVRDREVGEALAGMLEAAGLTVERHPMEGGAFFELLLSNTMPGMMIFGNSPTFGFEDGPLTSNAKTSSVVKYCSLGEIDERAAEAAAMPAGPDRDALYAEIGDTLTVESVCPVVLYEQKAVFATAPNVHGFEPRADESWDQLPGVWIE